MKILISQPMNGKSNNEIKKEREELIEKFENLHIEVVNNIIEESADPKIYNEYHPALFYLSKTIDIMAQVDAVYFMDGWEEARGCRVEREICKEYDILILDRRFFEKPGKTISLGTCTGLGITTTKANY